MLPTHQIKLLFEFYSKKNQQPFFIENIQQKTPTMKVSRRKSFKKSKSYLSGQITQRTPKRSVKSNKSKQSAVIKIPTPQLTPQQQQLQATTNKLRQVYLNNENKQIARLAQNQKKVKLQMQQRQKNRQLIEDLTKKKIGFNYDYNGNIIYSSCKYPKRNLFTRAQYSYLKKQKVKEVEKPAQPINQRQPTYQIFHTMLKNTMLGTMRGKHCIINQPENNQMNNQVYNNNFKRQITNLNIIELNQGVKFTQIKQQNVQTKELKVIQKVNLGQFSLKEKFRKYQISQLAKHYVKQHQKKQKQKKLMNRSLRMTSDKSDKQITGIPFRPYTGFGNKRANTGTTRFRTKTNSHIDVLNQLQYDILLD